MHKEPNRRTAKDDLKNGKFLSSSLHETSAHPVHWHEYYELEIILSGSATHVLNGRPYEIARGSAYLLNPTDFHEIKGDAPIILRNLSFDESCVSDRPACMLALPDTKRTFTLDERAISWLEATAALLEDDRLSSTSAREFCDCILAFLLRTTPVSLEVVEPTHYARMKKAIAYLDMHFRRAPSLAEVAAVAGFHPAYFSELFRRVTGESFTKRLNALRIGYARTLLAGGVSVTEACYGAGFGSSSNFLRTFKRYTGVSPDDYKKSQCAKRNE